MKKLAVFLIVGLMVVSSVGAISFTEFLQGLLGNMITGKTISIESCDETIDIAAGKNVKASSSGAFNSPKMAIDGKDSTYWDSGKAKGSINVDLGQAKTIGKVKLKWSFNTDLAASSRGRIEVSIDEMHWTEVATPVITTAANAEKQTAEFSPVLARYVRFRDKEWYGSTIKLYSFEVYQSCKSEQQCTETEVQDIYKKGTSKVGSEEKTDYCSGSTIVMEYYCSSDKSKIELEAINCDGWCKDGACIAKEVSCNNLIMDGDETDVDCGGKCIKQCDDGKKCKVDKDCRNGICTKGICQKKETGCTPGYRKAGKYCNEKGVYEEQKTGGCENSFECKTNLCVDGSCVSSTVWQKLLALVKE